MLIDEVEVELMELEQVKGVTESIVFTRILKEVQGIKTHLSFNLML